MLAGGAVVAAAPELWVPKRTIFLPPVGGWPANQLFVIGAITREAMYILQKNMTFVYTYDQPYDLTFARGVADEADIAFHPDAFHWTSS